jgi:hypothetical protein
MFTIASHERIMDELSLINLSHHLVSIYAISFIISLYSILVIGIQTSNISQTKF